MQTATAPTVDPWQRRKGEPARWFGRFTAFRLMGSRRSLLAVYVAEREATAGESGASSNGNGHEPRRPQSVPRVWSRAAAQWDWRERAEAWDAVEAERIEAEAQATNSERQRALMAREWESAQALFNEAGRLLTDTAGWQPGKVREVGRDVRESDDAASEPEIVNVTVERDLAAVLVQAATLMDRASQMGRRAVGLPTGNGWASEAAASSAATLTPEGYRELIEKLTAPDDELRERMEAIEAVQDAVVAERRHYIVNPSDAAEV